MRFSNTSALARSTLIVSALLWLGLTLFALPGSAQSQIVKKSSSGICHPPESSYYERTQNFRPFEALQACVDSGGRLPANLPRSAVSEGSTARTSASSGLSTQRDDYERSQFGHGWDDADGDCQDSRAEALIAASTTTVRFADQRRCRVVTGRWISPFTGEVIQNSSDVDIDHIVPLKWAWDRGASGWTDNRREEFANDPRNLIPVEASLNRSKGARGPDEWLPPANQCEYVARFVRIVHLYSLNPTATEDRAIQSLLEKCR